MKSSYNFFYNAIRHSSDGSRNGRTRRPRNVCISACIQIAHQRYLVHACRIRILAQPQTSRLKRINLFIIIIIIIIIIISINNNKNNNKWRVQKHNKQYGFHNYSQKTSSITGKSISGPQVNLNKASPWVGLIILTASSISFQILRSLLNCFISSKYCADISLNFLTRIDCIYPTAHNRTGRGIISLTEKNGKIHSHFSPETKTNSNPPKLQRQFTSA